MRLILRIKKIYLEKIASGEKTSEYRSNTSFYQKRLFAKSFDQVEFHYQSNDRVICKIESISLIKRPDFIDPVIVPTVKCFEIKLKNARRFVKK